MNTGTRRFPWSILAAILLVGIAFCSCETNHRYEVKYYYTSTDDGYTLALRRYKPENPSATRNPVILCHGLSYNLLFWDLGEKVSLPRYLAQAGYDVWALSLRGSCPSSQPLNSSFRRLARFNIHPETLKILQKRVITDMKMIDWSVDDHIQYDVPASIRFVCEQTNHQKVHWIGHSMGGMIMFAFLEQKNAHTESIKSFVGIAVPMTVFHPLNKPLQFLLDVEFAVKAGSKVIGTSAPATWGAIFGDLNTPMNKLFYNNKNMDDGILRALFYRAEEEMGSKQRLQLMHMVKTERFTSVDQSNDYTAGLAKVTTPTYLLCGTVDNMATVGAVKYTYRQIQSEEKQFSLFGRVNSQKNDYGHDDLVIGIHAQKEVYPTILDWLDEHPSTPHEQELMLKPATHDTDVKAGKSRQKSN
jgi:lysosomal acid lipase/cholesteryl ester hydrolase